MQVKKENIKEKIMNSARKEFLKHGYVKASLRVIAEKEGLTKGAVYSYFKNKDTLFYELAAPAVNFIEGELQYDDCYYGSEVKEFFFDHKLTLQGFRNFANAVLNNYESFKLLLFCSAGSSLQNYKERIIQLYSKSFYKTIFLLTETAPCHENIMNKMFVHTLATIYVSFLEEIVLHEPNRKEVDNYVEQMAIFVHSGIKKLYFYQMR